VVVSDKNAMERETMYDERVIVDPANENDGFEMERVRYREEWRVCDRLTLTYTENINDGVN
jgi:hypothetical protein